MNLLETDGLTVDYGGIHALRGVSIRIPEGKIVSIIGANGAGKSTLLKSIAGIVQPSVGAIRFAGDDIVGLPAYARLDRGVALCPEGRKLFPEMTVAENIRMGAYRMRDKARYSRRLEHLYESFPRIRERRKQIASSLSGGEQQMVAIARALMSEPRLLMLDEPTLGLAPKLIHEVAKLAVRVNREGLTVILVEQNAKLALRISDYAYVLETGSVVLEGIGQALLESDKVQMAYLGGAGDEI